MDPETEFDLKYTTAEHALQLARKANQKFGSVDSSVLTVELVGSAVLKMGGVSNAWLDFHTLIRAGGAELGAFIETATPILEGLSGVLSANTGASLRASDLVGFQACVGKGPWFVCRMDGGRFGFAWTGLRGKDPGHPARCSSGVAPGRRCMTCQRGRRWSRRAQSSPRAWPRAPPRTRSPFRGGGGAGTLGDHLADAVFLLISWYATFGPSD